MKKSDISLILVVVIFSATLSVIVSSLLINPKRTNQKVPVVDPISAEFPDVKNDAEYSSIFNSKSINPSLQIKIGGPNNQPFKSQ